MKMMHKMRISWPDGYDKDKCVEQLVDNILARFPDAEVTSAPIEMGEETVGGYNSRWIEQTFTSPFFDRASHAAVQLVLNELESMRESLHEDDSPFDGLETEFITSVMNSIIDHLTHTFLEDDCDQS